jgi:hypothetical protein
MPLQEAIGLARNVSVINRVTSVGECGEARIVEASQCLCPTAEQGNSVTCRCGRDQHCNSCQRRVGCKLRSSYVI